MKHLILNKFPNLTFDREISYKTRFYAYQFGFGLSDYQWMQEYDVQVLIEPKNGMQFYLTFY